MYEIVGIRFGWLQKLTAFCTSVSLLLKKLGREVLQTKSQETTMLRRKIGDRQWLALSNDLTRHQHYIARLSAVAEVAITRFRPLSIPTWFDPPFLPFPALRFALQGQRYEHFCSRGGGVLPLRPTLHAHARKSVAELGAGAGARPS